MSDKLRTSDYEHNLSRIVENAIESEIGRIDALPPEVAGRLREVYREFMPVYVEMIRIRDNYTKQWQPKVIAIDPEVVEGMLHFFSDYQRLARRFKQVNRQVKYLLTLDRWADFHRYEACVKKIVSRDREVSIMSSIIGQ